GVAMHPSEGVAIVGMRSNETREPPLDPTASRRRLVRRYHRAFAKVTSNYRQTKRIPWASALELRRHIERALRAVDFHIVKGEHRLFEHGKLMEKLKDRSSVLVIAHQLQLNLETGLDLMRSTRVRLLKELEQIEMSEQRERFSASGAAAPSS